MVPQMLHRARSRRAGRPARSAPLGRLLSRSVVWLALATIVATGAAVLVHLGGRSRGDAYGLPAGVFEPLIVLRWIGSEPVLRLWVVLPIWALVGILSNKVRTFLAQFLGDVAIYVSSHRVNEFQAVRGRIRETAQKATCAIYGAVAGGADERRFQYRSVIVMAHSLGSVIAYDAWNATMNQDLVLRGGLRVRERTPLLLTFGSPLDKTAFLFRAQLGRVHERREALASAVQAAIVDEKLRPRRWVNLWSRDDWVSGELTFYDDPGWPAGDSRRVENREDPEACTPGVCHNDYWANDLLAATLFDGVMSA
jgi:hypothetical protein